MDPKTCTPDRTPLRRSKLCPSGYWCTEGTITANASSALSPRPQPCAAGTYCLIGVKTNRTVRPMNPKPSTQNHKFSTPRP